MLPPNSTVRTVDVFALNHKHSVTATDPVTLCDCYETIYNEAGGCDNMHLTASYQRQHSFLATIRYFRERGYSIVKGTFRAKSGLINSGPYVRLERVTVPDFPMPFVPAKYTIIDDSEMPF